MENGENDFPFRPFENEKFSNKFMQIQLNWRVCLLNIIEIEFLLLFFQLFKNFSFIT